MFLGIKPFPRLQMCRLAEEFETYETVFDRGGNEASGRKATVQSEPIDNIQTLGVIMEETPIKTVRRVLSENNPNMIKSCIHIIHR